MSIVHVSKIIRIVKTIECEIVGKSSGANEPRDVLWRLSGGPLWRLSEVVKGDHSSMSERGYERTLERGSGMTAASLRADMLSVGINVCKVPTRGHSG